jgi:hypothetical protein
MLVLKKEKRNVLLRARLVVVVFFLCIFVTVGGGNLVFPKKTFTFSRKLGEEKKKRL